MPCTSWIKCHGTVCLCVLGVCEILNSSIMHGLGTVVFVCSDVFEWHSCHVEALHRCSDESHAIDKSSTTAMCIVRFFRRFAQSSIVCSPIQVGSEHCVCAWGRARKSSTITDANSSPAKHTHTCNLLHSCATYSIVLNCVIDCSPNGIHIEIFYKILCHANARPIMPFAVCARARARACVCNTEVWSEQIKLEYASHIPSIWFICPDYANSKSNGKCEFCANINA